MPPKQVAPPKPRAGQQRQRKTIHRGRIEGLGSPAPTLIRAGTPTFRASTPTHQAPSSGRSGMKCPNPECPSPNIVESDQGGYVCATCGTIAEEDSGLVSEQAFTETGGGRTMLQGVQIGEGQTHQRTYAPGGATGVAGREATANREKTERYARFIMTSYTTLLGVEESEVASGLQIFKLAWTHRFIQGRTIESVAVVCLYLACRRRTRQEEGVRRPYYALMLIDFAEKLNVDVFALGKMYGDLVRKLYLDRTKNDGRLDQNVTVDLLAMGPEVLIDKFVKELDFRPQEDKVKRDAIRIVARMKRDWMSTGRRPAGVCGAAIILAARMNNFRRTTREVVLTAKVTEITINKRLEEFKDTPSSSLSIDDFRDNEVLNSINPSDPPAYQRANNPAHKKKRGRPRKHTPIDTTNGEEQDHEEEDGPPARRLRIDSDGYKIPDLPSSRNVPVDPLLTDMSPENESTPRGPGRPAGSKNWRAPPASAAELAIEAELERDVLEALRDNPELDPNHEIDFDLINESSSYSQTNVQQAQPSQPTPSPQPSSNSTTVESTRRDPVGPAVNTNVGNTGTVSLSPTLKPEEFDDDPEVAICLLSEAEKKIKEIVWVNENADWLRQDHAKRIKRELKEAEMREKGIDPAKEAQKKGHRTRKDGSKRAGRIGDVSYLNEPEPGQKSRKEEQGEGGTGDSLQDAEITAAESMRKMMKTRGVYSRRVNYDVLDSIYGFEGSESRSRSRSVSQSHTREGSIASVASSTTAAAAANETLFNFKNKPTTSRQSPEKRDTRKRTNRESDAVTSRSPSATQSPLADDQHQPPAGATATSPKPRSRSQTQLRSPPQTQPPPIDVADQGVEEVVGPIGNIAEDQEGEVEENLIHDRGMAAGIDNEDSEGDEDDYVDEDDGDDAGGRDDEEDVEAAFDGRYAPKRTWE